MLGFIRLRTALEELRMLGVELTEENFVELSEEEIQKAQEDLNTEFDPSFRWFVVCHDEIERTERVTVVNEEDKFFLLKAVDYIYRLTEGLPFECFEERMFFLQGALPPVNRGSGRGGGAEIIQMPVRGKPASSE